MVLLYCFLTFAGVNIVWICSLVYEGDSVGASVDIAIFLWCVCVDLFLILCHYFNVMLVTIKFNIRKSTLNLVSLDNTSDSLEFLHKGTVKFVLTERGARSTEH